MSKICNMLVGSVLDTENPFDYSEVASRHLPYIAVTVPFLLASRVVPMGLGVLPSCIFKRITGVPCMFCGYTRAFQNIARGNFEAALADNPAAAVLFAFMLAVAVWNGAALLSGRIIRPGRVLKIGNRRFVVLGVIVFFVLNWVYRLTNSGCCFVDF